MTGYKGVEPSRKHRTDFREPLVDVRADLGTALVALAELVARVLRERLHTLADAALRIAERLQDWVHPAVQLLKLLQAHLMDLVRREVRRRRRLERPPVIFFAVRT